MARSILAKLLRKNGPLDSILSGGLAPAAGVTIEAEDGTLLWGALPTAGSEALPALAQGAYLAVRAPVGEPVLLDGQVVGWVCGGANPAALAELLAFAAHQENEKKAVAAELLDRYRELNLLYHLSETLGASTSPQGGGASTYPQAIAHAALAEAIRLIPAAAGLVLLKQAGQAAPRTIAAWGADYSLVPHCGLVARVLQSGKAELANASVGDACFSEDLGQLISLVAAPLKTEKNILGALLLIDQPGRVFSAGELKFLNTIAQQAAPLIEVSRLYQIELEQAAIERELQMARQVQESLLPPDLPRIAGWQFNRRWRPAHGVSGDFYDVIAEGRQTLGLVIADITDKGMAASLFMVFVRSALRASVTRRGSPAQAINHTNRVICLDSVEGLFATLFYARLHTGSGKIAYVNAGHPPPLLYRRAQDELLLLVRTGMALGVDVDVNYACETIQLEPGDFIVFYTDGIIEATDLAQNEYGLERLQAEVRQYRDASTEEILDGLERSLAQYCAGQPAADDVTLMVVKRV